MKRHYHLHEDGTYSFLESCETVCWKDRRFTSFTKAKKALVTLLNEEYESAKFNAKIFKRALVKAKNLKEKGLGYGQTNIQNQKDEE